MTKFWFKGCKHCGGDLYEVSDLGERYVKCLQCARGVYDTEDIKGAVKQTGKKGKKAA
ncbi:MAG: hypothetical protein HYV77_00295 [Candidatus Wildermuthbacteria bacterium]|nr:hypothetical protein [Candidatus Wildermuthbacteria bacterium]